jgi:ArsR family transcriptional regulator, arsenate/arsenite/antimonite-responsive transcriptional repressor
MSNRSLEPVAALAALAHEQRLAIFRLLVQAGPEGLPAGAIAEAMQSPASSISFHLANLTRAGMIAQRRESRSLIYAADYEGFQALIGFLLEDCCGGRPDICSPLAALASRAACCDVKGQA